MAACRQIYRPNHPASIFAARYTWPIWTRYIILSSLEARFSQVQSPAIALSLLHPAQMSKIKAPDLKIHMEEVSKFYELEKIGSEAEVWRLFGKTGRRISKLWG